MLQNYKLACKKVVEDASSENNIYGLPLAWHKDTYKDLEEQVDLGLFRKEQSRG